MKQLTYKEAKKIRLGDFIAYKNSADYAWRKNRKSVYAYYVYRIVTVGRIPFIQTFQWTDEYKIMGHNTFPAQSEDIETFTISKWSKTFWNKLPMHFISQEKADRVYLLTPNEKNIYRVRIDDLDLLEDMSIIR